MLGLNFIRRLIHIFHINSHFVHLYGIQCNIYRPVTKCSVMCGSFISSYFLGTIRYIGHWFYRQYLLIGSVCCWFGSFHGMCWLWKNWISPAPPIPVVLDTLHTGVERWQNRWMEVCLMLSIIWLIEHMPAKEREVYYTDVYQVSNQMWWCISGHQTDGSMCFLSILNNTTNHMPILSP